MNTNSNVYTVIYTTLICVIVAAVLAFASQSLKPRQDANEKAETIRQILTAAQFEFDASSNEAILGFYKSNIAEAFLVDADGQKTGTLDTKTAQIYGVSDLKAQNYNIKGEADYNLPVYIFKNGTTVLPIYGAGLWGPVWGYIALDSSCTQIAGAYFDHESETPGLGGKIKDDPEFRGQFAGKTVNTADEVPFYIVKGGAPAGQTNAIDAISGATMTSKGLDEAINIWLKAYANYAAAANNTTEEE
ncbi:MAG: NADH:ubiquinone reductase (Na(+)-transporting) subunit C [Bacteroidales bacterium]|nr:NADH:ubiquinone reductase (Na(+)-transporting) subunit C [Bacteroidales bacterium]